MTDLIEILRSGLDVNLTVKSSDLIEFAHYLVEHTKDEMISTITEDKQEVYLSPGDVCKFLSVTTTTLWRWEKLGYLNSIRIGGKKKYPKSVIKQKFTNNRNFKN